jgi:hypothetical protein
MPPHSRQPRPAIPKTPTLWQRIYDEHFQIHLAIIIQELALALVFLAVLAIVFFVLQRLETQGVSIWFIQKAAAVDSVFILMNVAILGLDTTGKGIVLMWMGWRKVYAKAS